MPKVAAVRLTYNPRTLWFDPAGVEFSRGDALIVRTAVSYTHLTLPTNSRV